MNESMTEPPTRRLRQVYRRIARNSVLLASGTAAASLFTMLAVAIAARALSPRDFGVLVLLQSAVLMVGSLASLSTQQPVIKLGSDAYAAKDRNRLGEVVSMGLIVDTVAALAAFVVAALAITLSRSAIGLAEHDVGSAWLLAISLLFSGYPTSNGIFRLYDRFGMLSLIQTLSAAGLLCAYAVLYAVGAALPAYVAAWASYLALSSILQIWFSLVLLRRDQVRLRFRKGLFATEDGRTLLHYSWSTWGMSTAATLRTNGDSLLVGALVSVEAAGIYNVARQIAGLVRKFNTVYSSSVFPEIARLGAVGDIAAARRVNRHMLAIGLAGTAAAVLASALFGHLIVRLLFGARFEPAYLPFVILTGAAMVQLVSLTPSMCVQVFRGPRLLFVFYAVASVAFGVAAIPLTAKWSISGMAIAQLVFSVALTVMCHLAVTRALSPPVSSPASSAETPPS